MPCVLPMSTVCGDLVLLSTSGTAVPAYGSERFCAPRLAGNRKDYGGLPSLGCCNVSNGSRKRTSRLAIRASKSGSVDAPASTKASRGPAEVQSHLALLERMTENSTASQGEGVMTIRDQLSSQIEPEASEVVVPLANEEKKSPPVSELTISQKRNMRRQNYLKKSSERNDVPFFAAVTGFVLLPPILILGLAIASGYIELFP